MTTTGATHGTERRCASCGLTYRYPRMATFTCQGCGYAQPWVAPDESALRNEVLGVRQPMAAYEQQQQTGTTFAPVPEIDLRIVHGYTNTLSNDALRRLHDQLAILNLVDEANRWRHEQTGHFQQVKAVLANAGVRFET